MSLFASCSYPARLRAQCLVVAALSVWAIASGSPSSAQAQEIAFTAIGQDLYTVRVATGQLGLVGDTGFEIAALALSPSNVLFAVEDVTDQLLVVDRATGQAAMVGPLGIDILIHGTDLSFDRQGQLWMLVGQRLYRIDIESGAATTELDVDLPGLGIAWAGSQLYTADDRLYIVDPATGEFETMGPGSPISGTISLSRYRRDLLLSLTELFAGPGSYFHLETIHTGTGAREPLAEMPNGAIGLAVQGSRSAPVPTLGWYGVVFFVAAIALSGLLYVQRGR